MMSRIATAVAGIFMALSASSLATAVGVAHADDTIHPKPYTTKAACEADEPNVPNIYGDRSTYYRCVRAPSGTWYMHLSDHR